MKLIKPLAVVGAAATLLLAAPAFAGPPYGVAVGGNSTAGTHTMTAASTTAIKFVVHHGSTLVNMSCTSASAAGTVRSGNPLAAPNAEVGQIASSSWSGCLGPGGLQMNVVQNGTWTLNATGPSTTALETVAGQVANVNATVSSVIPGLCQFTVAGAANGSFDETTQTLAVNETAGNLTISSFSGCSGTIGVGDPADFVGSFAVSVPDGAVNIF